MNGELAYELDIGEAFNARIRRTSEPRWLVFLERTLEIGATFTPVSATEAKNYVSSSVERLPSQLQGAIAMRVQTIEQIARLSSWRFRYGGTPQFAAKELLEFVVHRRQELCV